MSIQKKINIRKSLIKDYKKQVAKCRDIASKLSLKNISAEFKENDIEPVACVKIKVYERDDGAVVMPVVRNCEHFGKRPCPIIECPYHNKYERYQYQEYLLNKAKIDKKIAFKRMFQRIK